MMAIAAVTRGNVSMEPVGSVNRAPMMGVGVHNPFVLLMRRVTHNALSVWEIIIVRIQHLDNA